MRTTPSLLAGRGSRAVVAMAAVAVGALATAPAAAAVESPPPSGPAHRTIVRSLTIDCAGDTVAGHVGLVHPSTATATITLLGRHHGTWSVLSSTTAPVQTNTNELAYTFALTGHVSAYRVLARVGDSKRKSHVIGDRTCQPPTEVPEAAAAAAVPAVMALTGGFFWLRRRRGALQP